MTSQEWRKLGLVYDASQHISSWAKHSALTPTPYLRKTGEIRVLCGFRDDAGVSRIGYVDLDPDQPTKIIRISKQPALDVGRAGCFDDNGVILGDVVRHEDKLFLFYVGFQLVAKVKFLAFTGVATSVNDGESFERLTDAPILDRHAGENFFAAVHSAHYEAGKWRLWYGAGDAWTHINGVPYPSYGVHFVETKNLFEIPYNRIECLRPGKEEYRIGRPRVVRTASGYRMIFTAGTVTGSYFPGTASSPGGENWTRDAEQFPLRLSSGGWDSRHLSYPAPLVVGNKTLLFYNGNDMGRNGFGIAELNNTTWLNSSR